MTPCACSQAHPARTIVVTGGPGAGKTAVLELLRNSICPHVHLVPESAGLLFGGGFPRDGTTATRRSAQRAIFHVQRELECIASGGSPALVVCDRGTVDGAAYWPGTSDLFTAVGTTWSQELARYEAVIHLRVPDAAHYRRTNPLRIETAAEAAAIDERLLTLWAPHPRRVVIDARSDFVEKARAAIDTVLAAIPPCCR